MPYVLLGQARDLDDRVPERVVVPRGTVVHHCTADTVLFGADELSIWDQMDEVAELRGGDELPNLALVLLEGLSDDEVQVGGHTLVLPGTVDHGDLVHLCTDTTGACPTTAEQVEAGAAHTCDGILAGHAGEELYWMEYGTLQFMDRETVRQWALLISAETVLATALRDRTEAAVRTGLPDWARDFVPGVVRRFVGRDPDRFLQSIEVPLQDRADAGRSVSVEDMLREELAEGLATELAAAIDTFVRAVLEAQTREVLRNALGRLSRAVREEAHRRDAPVDLGPAEDMASLLLDARLAGERDDLVTDDLAALGSSLRSFRADLGRTVLEDVVDSLAGIYRRLSGNDRDRRRTRQDVNTTS
ncbi:hypothetical protein [Streptomyces sp. WAC06614]|uniref:hypothetical protein n=1 Tax=Streptomyces sp. WAC06614 TaxID=2487416 RepID=UPI000F7B88B7|nr:hypothetical protein [Streptomyces sp. WAC06614]RSS80783.1 hypothetical protein EF918_12450 [Streptomyces sp. WAC06614]